jgi:hypothetical protein
MNIEDIEKAFIGNTTVLLETERGTMRARVTDINRVSSLRGMIFTEVRFRDEFSGDEYRRVYSESTHINAYKPVKEPNFFD